MTWRPSGRTATYTRPQAYIEQPLTLEHSCSTWGGAIYESRAVGFEKRIISVSVAPGQIQVLTLNRVNAIFPIS